MFSVSESAAGDVVAYLEDGEADHRRVPFDKKLSVPLERHGIEFDSGHYLD